VELLELVYGNATAIPPYVLRYYIGALYRYIANKTKKTQFNLKITRADTKQRILNFILKFFTTDIIEANIGQTFDIEDDIMDLLPALSLEELKPFLPTVVFKGSNTIYMFVMDAMIEKGVDDEKDGDILSSYLNTFVIRYLNHLVAAKKIVKRGTRITKHVLSTHSKLVFYAPQSYVTLKEKKDLLLDSIPDEFLVSRFVDALKPENTLTIDAACLLRLISGYVSLDSFQEPIEQLKTTITEPMQEQELSDQLIEQTLQLALKFTCFPTLPNAVAALQALFLTPLWGQVKAKNNTVCERLQKLL
jgi:hypothetical protein